MKSFYLKRALLFATVAILVYGMSRPPAAEGTWLWCLWLAALPAGYLAFAEIPLRLRVSKIQRSLQTLTVIMALGFGMLTLELLREQVIWSQDIAEAVAVNAETGETSSNVRAVMAANRVHRGVIRDRNGTVVVDTTVAADGTTARSYPVDQPAAFAPVVGFVSPRYGVSGVEATYGDYLSGTRNPLGQLFRLFRDDTVRGDDVELTIDGQLQQAVYGLLGDRVGSVVVLNPRTGAVLALASTPSYDPRDLTPDRAVDRLVDQQRIDANWQRLLAADADQPLLNRALQGRYAPGSTFKIVTAAAALEHAGIARPDDITCPNEFQSEPGAPPVVNAVPNLAAMTGEPASLRSVVAFSCNTAFAQYALRLGAARLASSAERFGFVTPTNPNTAVTMADLPMQTSTLYVDDGFLTRAAALADTGFGQGQLLVTPLQMALVAAAVANDGVVMQPFVVQRVVNQQDAALYTHITRPVRRAVSSLNAVRLRDAMRYAVTDGFGAAAQHQGVINVAGKSGTAENPTGIPHAWFIAYAPAENPRFAVAVMLEYGGEGSNAGAALAGQVLAAAAQTVAP
jgi:penicillin-binding protein A